MRKLQVIVICLVLSITVAFSQIPQFLSYQGMLNKPDGEYKFTFKLYDAASEGTMLWMEQKTLKVANGLFSTALGDITPFGSNVRFDRPYWLGVQIGDDPEMTPRVALTSVGYAMRALRADTALVSSRNGVWAENDSSIYYQGGNVGIGSNAPEYKMTIKGKENLFGISPGKEGTDLFSTGKLSPHFETYFTVNYGKPGEGVAKLWLDRDGNLKIFGGQIQLYGPDFKIGLGDGRPIGKNVEQRALVHAWEDILIINYMNDFEGGVEVMSDMKVHGRTSVSVLEIRGGSDLAEPFEISHSDSLPAGAVVVIDKDNPGKLKLATEPYDKRVAGVISGAGGINPGLTLNQEGIVENGQHVALSGRVYALASTCNGPIEPGDLLTTSNVPGYAMKATNQKKWPGAVIGKAMTGLEGRDGLVLILVNLQ